jgi:hypothetical protein
MQARFLATNSLDQSVDFCIYWLLRLLSSQLRNILNLLTKNWFSFKNAFKYLEKYRNFYEKWVGTAVENPLVFNNFPKIICDLVSEQNSKEGTITFWFAFLSTRIFQFSWREPYTPFTFCVHLWLDLLFKA